MSRLVAVVIVLLVGFSCRDDGVVPFFGCQLSNLKSSYVVTYDPYGDVDWRKWTRAVSQFHDHIDTNPVKLLAYDKAGYDAVSLMHYEGDESNSDYRRNRVWPLDAYFPAFPSEEEFYTSSESVKRLIPSMEEVGFDHVLSPFMTQYIAKYDPLIHPRKEPFHYSSTQEALNLINEFGGLPIVAHPTLKWDHYSALENFVGIEVYNAYFAYKHKVGELERDYNEHFPFVWDVLLRSKSTKIWGLAVNDHYGPYQYKPEMNGNEEVFDSGKVLLLTPDYTITSLKNAVSKGSFFAVHDYGRTKKLYPKINSIAVSKAGISLATDAAIIRWIYCSHEIGTGPTLDLSSLPAGMNYVRAEVSNENGTVFLQPFSIQPL